MLLVSGPAYMESEWRDYAQADFWRAPDDTWLFQGQPIPASCVTPKRHIIARWMSHGGYYWLSLYKDVEGYGYLGSDGTVGLLGPKDSDAAAIAEIEGRLHEFTPSLKRVAD